MCIKYKKSHLKLYLKEYVKKIVFLKAFFSYY